MLDQLLGCIDSSCLWELVLANLSCLPLGGCRVHSDPEVTARLISGFLYCLEDRLDRFLIRLQCRSKATLISNGGCKSTFF